MSRDTFWSGVIICGCVIGVFILGGVSGYNAGVKDGKEASTIVSTMSEKYVGTIQDCNRINLLSCLACHQFPAYAIDVQPEIWEE